MCVNQKWTIQMKNSIDGVMLPQIDPFDKSVFYVSDGLHSTFSSMRFRKLSIETGKEQSNILIRDGARCIYCDKEYIYVFLNKRILKLHRSDLTIADEYKERIPRYTDYVNSDGEGIFLLGNHNADSLSVFDLRTRCGHRKKIGGCCGIFKTEADTFLIFNYDSILEYSLKGNKLNRIADTENYTECTRGKSGNIGLSWKGAANVLGFELSQCCPKGYEMEGVQVFRDIKEAVKGKDIICTDSLPTDILGDFEHYQITKEIMDMANENAILNPCPPFYRGEEVSEDVIYSDYFVGYQFKKNLLEVQQAIVIYCLMNEGRTATWEN